MMIESHANIFWIIVHLGKCAGDITCTFAQMDDNAENNQLIETN